MIQKHLINILLWWIDRISPLTAPDELDITQGLARLHGSQSIEKYIALRDEAIKRKMASGIALTNRDAYAYLFGQRKELLTLRLKIQQAHERFQRERKT